jgi:hypothetical protein
VVPAVDLSTVVDWATVSDTVVGSAAAASLASVLASTWASGSVLEWEAALVPVVRLAAAESVKLIFLEPTHVRIALVHFTRESVFCLRNPVESELMPSSNSL